MNRTQTQNPSLICFYDQNQVALYSKLYPELKSQLSCTTWMQVVNSINPLEPKDDLERADIFGKWCPNLSEESKRRFLFTIERLREALVLTHEHADFCFSLLPDSPKHTELKQLFHQYLDSELSSDWTEKVWGAIEMLKAGQIRLQNFDSISAVRGEEPLFLFDEFANSLQHAGVHCKGSSETWTLSGLAPTPQFKHRCAVLFGSESELIRRLVRRVRHLLDKGIPESKIVIPFFGKPEHKAFLQYALDHARVRYDSFLPDNSPEKRPSKFSILENVRQHSPFNLRERLKLAAILEACLSKNDSLSEQMISLLLNQSKLSESEAKWLREFKESEAIAAEPTESQGIALIPFHPLPLSKDFHQLGFVDASFSAPERYPFCLEEDEIDILVKEGFYLPKQLSVRERKLDILNNWIHSSSPNRVLFTSASIDGFQRATYFIQDAKMDAETTLAESSLVQLETPSLSATQLESYTKCPSRYFFAQRLRLETSKKDWQNKYALLFGSAVHDALENFLKTTQAPLSDDAFIEKLEQLFLESIQAIDPELSPLKPMHSILLAHFRKLAPQIPKMESYLRTLFGKLKPKELERAFAVEIEGISFRGKIDRIDQTEDGKLLVYDYKTGNVTFSPNHILKGEHFQSLIYLRAMDQIFEQNSVGFLFYDLKKGELRRGLMKEELVSKDVKKSVTRGHTLPEDKFQHLMKTGFDHVRSVCANIKEGDFTPLPDSQNCQYCEYVTHCRQGLNYA